MNTSQISTFGSKLGSLFANLPERPKPGLLDEIEVHTDRQQLICIGVGVTAIVICLFIVFALVALTFFLRTPQVGTYDGYKITSVTPTFSIILLNLYYITERGIQSLHKVNKYCKIMYQIFVPQCQFLYDF